MNLRELQRHLDQFMHEKNKSGITDFEGYSPIDMNQILHFTFGPESPIQLQKPDDSRYLKVPIFCQVKYLAELISKNGEIKLTAKGFLPTKIVSELYAQGFIKDQHIESGLFKLYKETDAKSINLTRIMLELAGLTKKRNGKLSLTKSSEKLLSNNHELFRLLLETFATKFNWAYYDGYGDNKIGQLGFGFSLILLSKFGHEKKLDSFYAEKYFKAFPALKGQIKSAFSTSEVYSERCYSIRSFHRFLDYFGFITIEEIRHGFDSTIYITKTELFDELIKCTPHKNRSGTNAK